MFRLNKLTDYGIMLMAHVAATAEDLPHTARGLARETRLPLPTVSKLLRELHDSGLLISHRGVKGGYDLARKAKDISVAEIIAALEGPVGFTECSIDPGACGMERSCAIKSNSRVIGDALRQALEQVMLADLNQQITQSSSHGRKNDLVSSIVPAAMATQGAR